MHIRALGQRINGYVRFMCAVGTLESCSGEAKQNAVTVFHDCLATLEPPLGHIPKKLRRRARVAGRLLGPAVAVAGPDR